MSLENIARISPPLRRKLGRPGFILVLSCVLALLLPTYTDTFDAAVEGIAQAAMLLGAPSATLATAPRGVATALQPPMQFEPNLGQTDPQVHFMARGTGYTVFLTLTEAILVLPAGGQAAAVSATTQSSSRHVIQLQVLEGNPNVTMTGVNETSTTINRLIGADPTQWQTNMPVYEQVRYDNMYPGIDLLYYGNQQQLEYDFIVHPGTDPSTITLGIRGADHATLDEEGHLLLSLERDTLRFQKPVLSQILDGTKTDVQGSFILREPDLVDPTAPSIQVAFAVGSYDSTLPLIIDPLVNYASALGGEGQDIGEAIALDNAGHGYLVGTTDSFTFPVTADAFQPSAIGPDRDIFVTKFDTETSEVLFSTYIGGEGEDRAKGVAVDTEGVPYITGDTNSLTFPMQNPLQETLQGESDAFVLKLAADGSSLLYSTYLGGTGDDYANSIVVDQKGQASITGATSSTEFPVVNAIDTTLSNGETTPQSDVFVTTLDAQGAALRFSTFLGGSGSDEGHALALDAEGNLYLTGETAQGTGFPVTAGPFQPTYGGGATDAFLVTINPRLTGNAALLYASYLGGSGQDVGLDLLVDAQQQAYLTGWTTGQDQPQAVASNPVLATTEAMLPWGRHSSPPMAGNPVQGIRGMIQGLAQQQQAPTPLQPLGQITPPAPLAEFPVTPNAYDATFNGGKDAFLAQVNVAASGKDGLVYATYVGGNELDSATAIGVDSLGRLCITGTTASPDYPVKNSLANQGTLTGGTDAFVTKFQPEPTTLLFSSYLGGGANEVVTGMRLDAKDNAYLTGQTRSTDFPLLTALEGTTLTGEPQAFVVKVQDPIDIVATLIPSDTYDGYLYLGEDQTWLVEWENNGPDPATGVQVVFEFEESGFPPSLQFKSIQNISGASKIDISSCSGLALSGPGGTLTCDVSEISVSPGQSSAALTFNPVTDEEYYISVEMVGREVDTVRGNNGNSFTGTIGEAPQRTLTVDFQGSGTGRVVARPGPSSATATIFGDETLIYDDDTTVSLVASPTGLGNNASVFNGWSGAGCTSSTSTTTVNMTQNRTCIATFDRNTVTVPNVVGQTQAAATAAINGVTGLSVGTVTQANSATVPSGNVISQNPGPGSAPSSTTVALVVSTGPAAPPPVTVPNVVGQSQAAATAAINGVTGLSVGTVTQANSATVPSGNVISQNPGPGSAPTGTTVALIVSTGPPPVVPDPDVNVPNVVGQTQVAATAAINGVTGLSLGGLTQANSATVAAGNVISQNPGPGSAPTGTTVALVVSTGPPPAVVAAVDVPNVVGQTRATATAILTNANLTLGAIATQGSGSVAAGAVISQNPIAGSTVSLGTLVNLVVSSGSELIVTIPEDASDATPNNGICETGTNDCTLRAAIQEANSLAGEQTITLLPGTYRLTLAGTNEEAAATGDLDITDDVIIESSTGNATDVIITAKDLGGDRVFDLPPGNSPRVTLRGLTIQEGSIVGSTGGGLRNAQGILMVEDCVVTGNQSNGSGGGLSQLGGALTLRDTMVTDNTSQGLGGGLQAQGGSVTIGGNTQFMRNTANFGGGLSIGRANVTLTNTQVEDNTAPGGGGGVYKFLSPGDLLSGNPTFNVQLSSATVRNNTPNNCGGTLTNGCQ